MLSPDLGRRSQDDAAGPIEHLSILGGDILLYDEPLLLKSIQDSDELPEVAVEPPPELGESDPLLSNEDIMDLLL